VRKIGCGSENPSKSDVSQEGPIRRIALGPVLYDQLLRRSAAVEGLTPDRETS